MGRLYLSPPDLAPADREQIGLHPETLDIESRDGVRASFGAS